MTLKKLRLAKNKYIILFLILVLIFGIILIIKLPKSNILKEFTQSKVKLEIYNAIAGTVCNQVIVDELFELINNSTFSTDITRSIFGNGTFSADDLIIITIHDEKKGSLSL